MEWLTVAESFVMINLHEKPHRKSIANNVSRRILRHVGAAVTTTLRGIKTKG